MGVMVEAMQQASGLTHFGVVVHDVVERVETFARLFDVPVWRGMHWHTEPGWLEDTTNNGQPVNHGYFTGRADVGKNRSGVPFGFEVVQPTYGPSHYKEDFLQVLGPAMAITVFVGAVVAVTFVPATMAILGDAIFWPGLRCSHRCDPSLHRSSRCAPWPSPDRAPVA